MKQVKLKDVPDLMIKKKEEEIVGGDIEHYEGRTECYNTAIEAQGERVLRLSEEKIETALTDLLRLNSACGKCKQQRHCSEEDLFCMKYIKETLSIAADEIIVGG